MLFELNTNRYKKPQSSNSIVKTKQENLTVDTKYRATDEGFIMYNYIESYIQNISEDRNFALGYFNKNGKISFIANGESDFFSSDILIINTKKEFDKSYLGNEIKLLVLESDSSDIETLIQDTIYEWWPFRSGRSRCRGWISDRRRGLRTSPTRCCVRYRS